MPVGVRLVIGMALGAVGDGRIQLLEQSGAVTTDHILAVRYGLKVGRVAAGIGAAAPRLHMVEFTASRNQPDHGLVDDLVD
jgi:hypothetical protein